MTFRVSISERAKRDIREILAWIGARSSKGAVSWLNALENSLNQLPKTATSCVAAAEADDFGVDMRQRLFKTRRGNTYRLVLLLRDEIVHLLAVRGAGQDLLQQTDIDVPE